MADEYVRAGEFSRGIESLSDQMTAGFSGVHARIGRLEDRWDPEISDQGKKIAVLEFQAGLAKKASDAATSHIIASKRQTATRASSWGTVAGTAAIIIVELLKALKAAYFSGVTVGK
jgi:hypothetical protein